LKDSGFFFAQCAGLCRPGIAAAFLSLFFSLLLVSDSARIAAVCRMAGASLVSFHNAYILCNHSERIRKGDKFAWSE